MEEKKPTPKETEPTHILTSKQERFCHEYIKDRNATQAAIRTGYSLNTAQRIGSENLSKPLIRYKVNQLIAAQIDRIKLSADFVVKELLKHATIDLQDAYDENGNLLPIAEWPEPLRKAVIQIETEELFDGRGKDRERIGTAKTIKITDRIRALELLGKHLKMFTDVHEIPGLADLAERLEKAEKKARACPLPKK
jgi:phage terminase small subunit